MDGIPQEVRDLAAKLQDQGYRPVLVATSDKALPLVLFQAPTIGQLSRYIAEASKVETGPLMAAVGLARQVVVYPSRDALQVVETQKPLVIMRAVQEVLRDQGLATRTEKKSLS